MSVRSPIIFQLVSATVVVLAWSLPRQDEGKLSAQELQRLADLEAARNARYYFSSDVQDQINDLTQHRDELRDGLKVRGSFSYSDGFLRRHVSYEADENGYRIIRYALLITESDLTPAVMQNLTLQVPAVPVHDDMVMTNEPVSFMH